MLLCGYLIHYYAIANVPIVFSNKHYNYYHKDYCNRSVAKNEIQDRKKEACVFFTANTSVTLPSQCMTYTTNNDSTRNVASGLGALCDNTLTAGWYRFMGAAGTQISTSTVSRDTCTTYYGGSFSGTMPSTAGTTTYGKMCFNKNGELCYASYSGGIIGVTNCNGYYVYYLPPVSSCPTRYCTRA